MDADGIIPAGAGKSGVRVRPRRAGRDYPRGCGEKAPQTAAISFGAGSSPRVRGKDAVHNACRDRVRIIPAGAGKRADRRVANLLTWDHPRGCGEKSAPARRSPSRPGSSPRVRGKDFVGNSGRHKLGIIPAGAGKRTGGSRTSRSRQDHPRGCGEKQKASAAAFHAGGSSPRVRGKGISARRSASLTGIIPAGAGKSVSPSYRAVLD